MKKSRILVLALALSAGLAGVNPGQPAQPSLAPAPAQTISQAPPSTMEVATDPAAAWDVVGAGPWWLRLTKKLFKKIACNGSFSSNSWVLLMQVLVCYDL